MHQEKEVSLRQFILDSDDLRRNKKIGMQIYFSWRQSIPWRCLILVKEKSYVKLLVQYEKLSFHLHDNQDQIPKKLC